MDEQERDPASYRDPTGYVFTRNGRIFRRVSPMGLEAYRAVRDSGALKPLIARGDVIEAEEVGADGAADDGGGSAPGMTLEHPRLPVISYPYEWPFEALKSAALLHLDIQLDLLGRDVALSDASAFNIQFHGAKPIFIDYLSFRPYRQGEPWLAHRQFCENFLNPLVLHSVLGVSYHSWLRGQPEGIASVELNRLLKLRHKMSVTLFSHVVLPAKIEQRLGEASLDRAEKAKQRGLSRTRFRALLTQLRTYIDRLSVTGTSTWTDYANDNTYDDAQEETKRRFVRKFASEVRPRILVDLGCNTGQFSRLCLDEGTGLVIGLDGDHGALRKAYLRAEKDMANFLPLYQDLANPSPDHGWEGRERRSLFQRLSDADGVLALAVVHHLAIGRNIPLDRVVDSILSMAPRGVIEFVPMDDPTVRIMLRLRDDFAHRYDRETFVAAVERSADIVDRVEVSPGGRELFSFRRRET
jgi:ribosomal protein L11 methylase PrmA